jgi:hypothetical protein
MVHSAADEKMANISRQLTQTEPDKKFSLAATRQNIKRDGAKVDTLALYK